MFWLILLFVVIAAVTAVGLLGYGGTTLADSGRAGLLRGLAALCGAGTCALYGWGLYGWGLLFVGGAGACALYGWGLLFVGGAGACALYGWGLLFV
ncbi:hypothetical protein RMT89_34160, partial [Streptomyces sp. P17]|nr:hypothetical protein [Streptomyces sp. P17]